MKASAAITLISVLFSASVHASPSRPSAIAARSPATVATQSHRQPFDYKGFRAGEIATPDQLTSCRATGPTARLEERVAYLAKLEVDAAASKYDLGKPLRDLVRADIEKQRAEITPEQRALDSELRECGTNGSPIAGKPTLLEEISLYRGRLSSVTIAFAASNFSDVADALTAKYGKPCEASVKEVQNRMGAKFTSPHFAWCFIDGKLEAEMLGINIETSSLIWNDPKNQPPKNGPKIDF